MQHQLQSVVVLSSTAIPKNNLGQAHYRTLFLHSAV